MAEISLEAVPPRRRRSRADAQQTPPSPVTPPVHLSWAALGVAAALVGQTGMMFFWAGGQSDRMTAVEHDVAPLKDGKLAEQIGRLDERSLRGEHDLDDLKVSVRRIWDDLQKERGARASL